MTNRFNLMTVKTFLAFAILLIGLAFAGSAFGGEQEKKWDYEGDLNALVKELDGSYPFFKLKGIEKDWEKTKKEVLDSAKECKTDEKFLELLLKLIGCLRDAHVGLKESKIQAPKPPTIYYPGVCFMPATEGRVVVMAAEPGLDTDLKPGTVVKQIDGKDARKFLEEKSDAAWEKGGSFSSPQRARLFEYRIPLCGEKNETHCLTIAVEKDKEREIKLSCDRPANGWPHTYNMPGNLDRSVRSAYHGELPGGFGYLYLRKIDPTVEDGIAKAATAHPNAKGWIVDLRGNGGGGYESSLVQKLKSLQKPVACLIDEGCISAGETFARDIVRVCDAKLFGSATAGSSSKKKAWPFPSGIGTLSLPVRSHSGIGGKPIEYHGVEPDLEVEAVPEEVREGKNSCLLKALEYLEKETKAK
jgi:hypothetical protein